MSNIVQGPAPWGRGEPRATFLQSKKIKNINQQSKIYTQEKKHIRKGRTLNQFSAYAPYSPRVKFYLSGMIVK